MRTNRAKKSQDRLLPNIHQQKNAVAREIRSGKVLQSKCLVGLTSVSVFCAPFALRLARFRVGLRRLSFSIFHPLLLRFCFYKIRQIGVLQPAQPVPCFQRFPSVVSSLRIFSSEATALQEPVLLPTTTSMPGRCQLCPVNLSAPQTILIFLAVGLEAWVTTLDNKSVGLTRLSSSVFGLDVRKDILWANVVWQRDGMRTALVKVKRRGEVILFRHVCLQGPLHQDCHR